MGRPAAYNASRANDEGVPCRRSHFQMPNSYVIMNLAQPLDPVLRDPFLRAIAIELARYQPEAIGPGLINQVGRSLQRQFLVAPALGGCRARGRGETETNCFPDASSALPWEAASR